jgi:hypothetical protein
MTEFMLVTCSSARTGHIGGRLCWRQSATFCRSVKPDPPEAQAKGHTEGLAGGPRPA